MTAAIATMVLQLVVLGVPCVYVFRGGRYYYGVAMAWGLAVVSMGLLAAWAGALPEEWAAKLPRGGDVGTAMGFGWVPGIVASTVGGVSAFVVQRFQKRNQGNSER